MDDQRPAPRFAVGQMVMVGGDHDLVYGPATVISRDWSAGWFYRVSAEPAAMADMPQWMQYAIDTGMSAPERLVYPYDPPADQSYDELMRRLTDPNEYQRNLERDYLTEQYGEPV